MVISARLEMRQGQQLVMTPQLQQAIRLLQYSNLELTAYVEGELERNPLLEREESDAPTPTLSGADAPETMLDLSNPRGDAADAYDTDTASVAPDASQTELAQDYGGQDYGARDTQSMAGRIDGVGARSMSHDGGDDNNLEAYVSAELSIKDHLTQQAAVLQLLPAERLIATYLIDLVDDAGYLPPDLDHIGDKLAAPDGMIERVLSQLQTLDPAGVFARSLAECLALQLKDRNRFDPMMAKLIDNLPMLAQHNLSGLRRAIGCDQADLADMIQELKGLVPKPGLKFGSTPMQPVVPDVLVRAARDGSWIIELNGETLPRVLVNRVYHTNVSRTARSDQDKGYLQDCLQSANWLVKSLDQRARTILRVAEEIVRLQDGFLAYGVAHLKPLNLKTVADKIGMHESTVSRVTSNKYMATPRGILELKYFFTSGINASEGEDQHSSESVRHRIKQLIEAERAEAVLSDDKLVELLSTEGIDIARRTVAKYREGMKIASSVQRRREKQATAKLAGMQRKAG